MTGRKDIGMVVKYGHERGNIEENAINRVTAPLIARSILTA
jgi:hypothetical protein